VVVVDGRSVVVIRKERDERFWRNGRSISLSAAAAAAAGSW
jgi:hypothetical protein